MRMNDVVSWQNNCRDAKARGKTQTTLKQIQNKSRCHTNGSLFRKHFQLGWIWIRTKSLKLLWKSIILRRKVLYNRLKLLLQFHKIKKKKKKNRF